MEPRDIHVITMRVSVRTRAGAKDFPQAPQSKGREGKNLALGIAELIWALIPPRGVPAQMGEVPDLSSHTTQGPNTSLSSKGRLLAFPPR